MKVAPILNTNKSNRTFPINTHTDKNISPAFCGVTDTMPKFTYPALDAFFERFIYYTHKYLYRYIFKNSQNVKTIQIPLKTRGKNSETILGDLVELYRKDIAGHSFKIKNKRKVLGENYIIYQPRETEYIKGTDIGITFSPKIHVLFTNTLAGRKKYKNLFNILNQAVLEKGISNGYMPKITFTPVKMGNSQRNLGMDTYQHFIGASDGKFSKEVIIDKLKKMVADDNFLFEETPQNILNLIKNEQLILPDTEAKLKQITKTRI